jgi:hypothetical protein
MKGQDALTRINYYKLNLVVIMRVKLIKGVRASPRVPSKLSLNQN